MATATGMCDPDQEVRPSTQRGGWAPTSLDFRHQSTEETKQELTRDRSQWDCPSAPDPSPQLAPALSTHALASGEVPPQQQQLQ